MIDAHQHFWTLTRPEVEWPTPDLAVIHRDFGPHDFRTAARSCNIDATVLVQSQPSDADTDWLLALAAREPLVQAVVGWVDLAAGDVVSRLHALTGRAKFRGVRPMLQGLHQDDWILRPKMHPALDALVERELGFDALILPRHLPHIATLARRHPKLRIVIDHAAKPAFRHDDLADWSADIGRFADLPNTCCKLSGLLTEARPEQRADPEVFQPCVARLLEVFGPQRLMWGSDWPVLELAGDYGGWLGLARELLERAGLSATDMHSVFDTNARDFYRITSTPLP